MKTLNSPEAIFIRQTFPGMKLLKRNANALFVRYKVRKPYDYRIDQEHRVRQALLEMFGIRDPIFFKEELKITPVIRVMTRPQTVESIYAFSDFPEYKLGRWQTTDEHGVTKMMGRLYKWIPTDQTLRYLTRIEQVNHYLNTHTVKNLGCKVISA